MKLAELLAFARAWSPYYRDLHARVPPGEARLDRYPIAEQEGFWAAAARGAVLTESPHGLLFQSGGTTGSPKHSYFTAEEWESFTRWFGEGIRESGIPEGARVANLFYAGDLYASFLFIERALERCPVLQLPLAGNREPETILEALATHAAGVVAGVPTTLLLLANRVRENPARWSGWRPTHFYFGGESLYPDQRQALEAAFPGVVCRSIGYASVDGGLLGLADLSCGPDEHRVPSQAAVIELVEEGTGRVIEEPGVPGRLLVTSLFRRLMPIVRYPAGDLAEWVEPLGSRAVEPLGSRAVEPLGSPVIDPPGSRVIDPPNSARKFRVLGRADEGARVGPVSVSYEDVRKILAAFPAVEAFQLVVEREGAKDSLRIRVSARWDRSTEARFLATFAAERPLYAKSVAQGLIRDVGLERVATDGLARNPRTGKLRRVVDERKG